MTAPAVGSRDEPPARGFLDVHQRATVEAAMARMIPTDDAAGASEARTVDFVDRYLAGIDAIYAKPDGSGFETLQGKQAWAWQQRVDSLRRTYAEGLDALDRLSRERHREDFVDLSEEDQDDVLHALENRTASSLEAPALQQTSSEADLEFVPLLATHTRQGFYADPVYGGNRDRVGWDVIGFPGPSSLAEVHTGRYSVVDYFADERGHPSQEDDGDA